MNYANILKQKLNIDCSEPLNAVIYARVSTDNEGQKESCANQVELALNYISKRNYSEPPLFKDEIRVA